MNKRFIIALSLLIFSITLVACGDETSQNEAEAEEVYKIGAIYSKTGPNSPLGEPEWNTTEMLVEEINKAGGIDGVPIEVILADDESSQEKATQEMNRLINDENVLAILGSSGSTESLAMKGIAMQQEVPMISAAASVQIVEPADEAEWVFKTPQSDVHAVERVYVYLQSKGIEKVATLTDSNAFGESGLVQLENLAESAEYDIDIVAKETYNIQDPDMTTQLTRINSSDAEAVIVWGTNPGPATIAVNMRDLDMEIPFIGSHGIANDAFLELAQDAAEDVVIPTGRLLFPSQIPEDDPHHEVVSTFYENYTNSYDGEPTNFASYGYDNLMLITEALGAGATDRAAIRDYLENDIKDWVGASGTFNMSAEDHNGLDVKSLVMAHVKDGKWTFLPDEKK